jgi:hypothetical protein
MKIPSGLIVKKSRNGKGIFATKNFLPEKKIFQITGSLITCYADDDMDEQVRANAIPYDKTRYISPEGTLGNFINHSCEPNAKVVKEKKKLFVVSIKPIMKGEEVLIDYSTILAADDVWELQCNCGSTQCRGVVKKFKTLPKKLRASYVAQGMVPHYIYK